MAALTADTTRKGRTLTGRAIGSCAACGAGIATEGIDVGTAGKCPHCSAHVRMHLVYGERSDVPCDGRCMGAVGPWCSCSCGGANHGRWCMRIDLVPVFEQEQARAVQAKRRAAHADRAKAKRRTAEERAAAGRAALIEAHPLLAALLTDEYADASDFMCDMRARLQSGEMTPRQVKAACDAIERDRERARQKADRVAREAAARAAGVTVPSGRLTFTGRIVSVRAELDRYSWQERYIDRCLIEHADGWRVWGTLPRGLEPPEPHGNYGETLPREETERRFALWKGWTSRLPGREVTIAAILERSEEDQLFGFFKRPRLVSAGPDPADTGPITDGTYPGPAGPLCARCGMHHADPCTFLAASPAPEPAPAFVSGWAALIK